MECQPADRAQPHASCNRRSTIARWSTQTTEQCLFDGRREVNAIVLEKSWASASDGRNESLGSRSR